MSAARARPAPDNMEAAPPRPAPPLLLLALCCSLAPAAGRWARAAGTMARTPWRPAAKCAARGSHFASWGRVGARAADPRCSPPSPLPGGRARSLCLARPGPSRGRRARPERPGAARRVRRRRRPRQVRRGAGGSSPARAPRRARKCARVKPAGEAVLGPWAGTERGLSARRQAWPPCVGNALASLFPMAAQPACELRELI